MRTVQKFVRPGSVKTQFLEAINLLRKIQIILLELRGVAAGRSTHATVAVARRNVDQCVQGEDNDRRKGKWGRVQAVRSQT